MARENIRFGRWDGPPPKGGLEPLPLDLELLRRLPDEGTMVAFSAIAPQVATLVKQLNDGVPPEHRLKSGNVQGSLRKLRQYGLVATVRVQPVTRGAGWQRTPEGKRYVRKHDRADDAEQEADLAPDYAPTRT